jgi:hypothetical protein
LGKSEVFLTKSEVCEQVASEVFARGQKLRKNLKELSFYPLGKSCGKILIIP